MPDTTPPIMTLRRGYSYTDHHISRPAEPPPGDRIDADLDTLFSAIAGLTDRIQIALDRPAFTPELLDELKAACRPPPTNAPERAESAAGAAGYQAEQATIHAARAQKALEAANAVLQRVTDIVEQTERAAANTARAGARFLDDATLTENRANDAELAAASAQRDARLSGAWAEYTQGNEPIPPDVFAHTEITGEHWSSRWWAHRAASYVGGYFAELYLGPYPEPPTTTFNGDPIPLGAIYYNTVAGQMFIWNGTEWVPLYAPSKAYMLTLAYTATAGQTTFVLSTPDMAMNSFVLSATTPEPLDLYVNGVRLPSTPSTTTGDWSVDHATSTVTLTAQLKAGDLVQIDVLAPASSIAPSRVQTAALLDFNINPATDLPGQIDGTRTTFPLVLVAPPHTPVAVASAQELFVSLDGVVQQPGTDYNVTGGNIIFGEAPLSGARAWASWYGPGSAGTGPGAGYLPITGGILTGKLTLDGSTPTLGADAASKAYVDSKAGGYGGVLDGRNYGIVADGVTDDTAALASAIAAAQATVSGGQCFKLVLPKGRILTGPQILAREIFIQGVQDNATVLVLKTGSTTACLTINPSGTAFPGGTPRGHIVLQDLRIENQVTKTGNVNAHGISMVNSPAWTCRVSLFRVTVHAMPGNGVDSGSFNGACDFKDCSIFNNALAGVNCNSCFDWHWSAGDIAVNGTYGVALSGCGQFVFTGTNIYSNGTANAQLYGGPGTYNGWHQFTDCMFDRGNQVGVVYDIRGNLGTVFKGCTFGLCSQVTPNTYSDVLISSGANNNAVFSGCFWSNNYVNDVTNPEKWALEFQGATQTVILDGTNTFSGGVLRTNAYAQVFLTASGNRQAFQGPLAVYTTQQYTGIQLNNATVNFASITGSDTNADIGILRLNTAGVTWAQISGHPAYGANFLNGDLWMGNGSAHATPTSRAIRATDGSGANIAGANLIVAPGRGTGTGIPGVISFRLAPPGTAGSGLNTEAERFNINYNGASITTPTQYAGLTISNGTNTVALLRGLATGNDNGALHLFNGGVITVQFSAANAWAPNFINNPLYLGNGATNATPAGQSLSATGGAGTNIAGGTLHLNGGASTGTGVGGSIMCWTTPAGSSGAGVNTAVNRLTLDGPGNVVVGTAALANAATNGFLYIPTVAGTPTGVPTAYTGRVPILFDTTANKIWVYQSGWKQTVALT